MLSKKHFNNYAVGWFPSDCCFIKNKEDIELMAASVLFDYKKCTTRLPFREKTYKKRNECAIFCLISNTCLNEYYV